MQKVNSSAILRKVDEWKNTPEMVPAVYRLFVFLKWSEIPEEYQKMYDVRAKDIWDEDYESIWKSIEVDTEVTIKAILDEMRKRNIVAALGLLPIILADMFVRGYKTGSFQGQLMKIVSNYREYITLDRAVAEMDTLNRIEILLGNYCAKTKIKLGFDLEAVVEKIFQEYMKFYGQDEQSTELEKSIEKVLDEYESRKEKQDVEEASV